MNLKPPSPSFAGVTQPSSDFQAVRDGRRGVPLRLDLDLSVARSIAAGTHAVIAIAGNSFYSDPLIDPVSGLPIGGTVIAQFEDVTLGGSSVGRYTVAPQFIAAIPFTRILVENPAQPGKTARLMYGTDVDFRPGINAQVSIAGNVSVVRATQYDRGPVDGGNVYGQAHTLAAGGAGNGTGSQIKNPIGNNKLVYVTACAAYSLGNASEFSLGRWDTDLAILTQTGLNQKQVGGAVGTAQLRGQNAVAGLPGGSGGPEIERIESAAQVYQRFLLREPIRLSAGQGVVCGSLSLNVPITVSWEIEEF